MTMCKKKNLNIYYAYIVQAMCIAIQSKYGQNTNAKSEKKVMQRKLVCCGSSKISARHKAAVASAIYYQLYLSPSYSVSKVSISLKQCLIVAASSSSDKCAHSAMNCKMKCGSTEINRWIPHYTHRELCLFLRFFSFIRCLSLSHPFALHAMHKHRAKITMVRDIGICILL